MGLLWVNTLPWGPYGKPQSDGPASAVRRILMDCNDICLTHFPTIIADHQAMGIKGFGGVVEAV